MIEFNHVEEFNFLQYLYQSFVYTFAITFWFSEWRASVGRPEKQLHPSL